MECNLTSGHEIVPHARRLHGAACINVGSSLQFQLSFLLFSSIRHYNTVTTSQQTPTNTLRINKATECKPEIKRIYRRVLVTTTVKQLYRQAQRANASSTLPITKPSESQHSVCQHDESEAATDREKALVTDNSNSQATDEAQQQQHIFRLWSAQQQLAIQRLQRYWSCERLSQEN